MLLYPDVLTELEQMLHYKEEGIVLEIHPDRRPRGG
jgi:hypothetical protein